jgi:hypothetical protein
MSPHYKEIRRANAAPHHTAITVSVPLPTCGVIYAFFFEKNLEKMPNQHRRFR